MNSFRNNLTKVYRGVVERFPVQPDQISWDSDWPEYSPTIYTSPHILKQPPYADTPINSLEDCRKFKWNSVDGQINRKSFEGTYKIDGDGLPLNPMGRTGLRGRGVLGKWGPNHAADSIVTRAKIDENGSPLFYIDSNGVERSLIQFIGIKRKDTGEWALPGGMVDSGEESLKAAEREFREEVLNSEMISTNPQIDSLITSLFTSGQVHVVYQGYVDDPRNTDNAWMETSVFRVHLLNSNILRDDELIGGSDAVEAKWIDPSQSLKLYASHKYFIDKMLEEASAE